MNEQDTMLIEANQRTINNERRISELEADIKEIRNDQKAIYQIATSVEVMAQRIGNIEEKVVDTNQKVDAQAQAWQETEKKLADKISDVEMNPIKETAGNINSVKMAIITSICSLLASGAVGCLIAFTK